MIQQETKTENYSTRKNSHIYVSAGTFMYETNEDESFLFLFCTYLNWWLPHFILNWIQNIFYYTILLRFINIHHIIGVHLLTFPNRALLCVMFKYIMRRGQVFVTNDKIMNHLKDAIYYKFFKLCMTKIDPPSSYMLRRTNDAKVNVPYLLKERHTYSNIFLYGLFLCLSHIWNTS